MAIEKKLEIDQIELKGDGSVSVRFNLLLVEGDKVLSAKYHRVAVDSTEAVGGPLGEVRAALQREGWGLLGADEIADVETVVGALRPRLKARGKLRETKKGRP